jgi:hypothetical protein
MYFVTYSTMKSDEQLKIGQQVLSDFSKALSGIS